MAANKNRKCEVVILPFARPTDEVVDDVILIRYRVLVFVLVADAVCASTLFVIVEIAFVAFFRRTFDILLDKPILSIVDSFAHDSVMLGDGYLFIYRGMGRGDGTAVYTLGFAKYGMRCVVDESATGDNGIGFGTLVSRVKYFAIIVYQSFWRIVYMQHGHGLGIAELRFGVKGWVHLHSVGESAKGVKGQLDVG